jgi:hypothetical protein
VGAAQTSTNGAGTITLSNQVSDADGDTCQLEFEWRSTAGNNWSNLWLTAVQASWGIPILSHTAAPPISSILTVGASGPVTNSVLSEWESRQPGQEILYSSDTQVRGRVWDGLFWSPWVTSQPFRVDNECPPTPTHFVSLVHRINNWSLNPVLSLRWDLVQEARGSGVTNYLFGVTTNLSLRTPEGSTPGRTASPAALPEGTNYWAWVCARDGCGNLSPPAFYGPCWIDATPPSAKTAVLRLSLSSFGHYLIGSDSVTGTWSGFSDAGSGIAGYYFAPTNAGGTRQGTWTTNVQGVLTGLAVNRTNAFYVWARDQLGWIGPATGVVFPVLSSGGAWDHDGILNSEEETAGTDASSASSLLRMGIRGDTSPTSREFILEWPGATNRHYSVSYSDHLGSGSDWSILPGCSNLAGISGIMSCTDRTVSLPTRFYRIRVTTP